MKESLYYCFWHWLHNVVTVSSFLDCKQAILCTDKGTVILILLKYQSQYASPMSKLLDQTFRSVHFVHYIQSLLEDYWYESWFYYLLDNSSVVVDDEKIFHLLITELFAATCNSKWGTRVMGCCPQSHDGCGWLAETAHHWNPDIRPDNSAQAENHKEDWLGKQVTFSCFIIFSLIDMNITVNSQ